MLQESDRIIQKGGSLLLYRSQFQIISTPHILPPNRSPRHPLLPIRSPLPPIPFKPSLSFNLRTNSKSVYNSIENPLSKPLNFGAPFTSTARLLRVWQLNCDVCNEVHIGQLAVLLCDFLGDLLEHPGDREGLLCRCLNDCEFVLLREVRELLPIDEPWQIDLICNQINLTLCRTILASKPDRALRGGRTLRSVGVDDDQCGRCRPCQHRNQGSVPFLARGVADLDLLDPTARRDADVAAGNANRGLNIAAEGTLWD